MSRDNGFPEQAATIPFRRRDGDVEVCLIRRRSSDTWGVPKGTVDPGDTLVGTALKETWEEAGLRGRLFGKSIGTYRYKKWSVTLTVAVYLMEVFNQVDEWEEAAIRERRWVPLSLAGTLLSRHPVRPLLNHAISLLSVPGSSRRA